MTLATLTCSPLPVLASAVILVSSARLRVCAPMAGETRVGSRAGLADAAGWVQDAWEELHHPAKARPKLHLGSTAPRRPQITLIDELCLQHQQKPRRGERL